MKWSQIYVWNRLIWLSLFIEADYSRLAKLSLIYFVNKSL